MAPCPRTRRGPRRRLTLGPAARPVYRRGSIQLLPVCSFLLILLAVIDVQGSVHMKESSFADQLYHRFPAPSSLMSLVLCPVLAWKILFEENRPTDILSSLELVSMIFLMYMGYALFARIGFYDFFDVYGL